MAHNYDINLINTLNNITMKNDPVINAKASKIVEAIKETSFRISGNIYKVYLESEITEALASLESSEREVLEGFAELMNKEFSECELNVCIHPSHIDRYLAEKQSKTKTK